MRDWEACYQNQDTPWDHGEAAPPLREYLKSHPVTGKVLVPGCGLGHDVRLLASQGAIVTGLDISSTALKAAANFTPSSPIEYIEADLLNLPKAHHNAYDTVFEHTCLCALDSEQRPAYADAIHQTLKPDGKLLAIFYCKVEDYDGSGPPHPITADEIDALFAGKFITIKAWTPLETYPSRAGGKEQMRIMKRID